MEEHEELMARQQIKSDEMDQFYELFFSVFSDGNNNNDATQGAISISRKEVTSRLLDKKEEFSRQVLELIFQQTFLAKHTNAEFR